MINSSNRVVKFGGNNVNPKHLPQGRSPLTAPLLVDFVISADVLYSGNIYLLSQFFPPGVILGAFYYGYMIFQIPGGWLALRLGGARLFGIAILVASIFTLLTPMATRWSPIALIVLRVLEGLALVS